MPYSLTNTSALPANIQKLSAKKRRQWVHIFNSAYSRANGDAKAKESAAFAQANGVVLKDKEYGSGMAPVARAAADADPIAPAGLAIPPELARRYGGVGPTINFNYAGNKDMMMPEEQPTAYVPYTVQQHQLSQDSVAYDPAGGTQGKMCANCQWFLTPDACIKVQGVISPTGVSNEWQLETEDEMAAMPVEISNVDELATAIAGNSEADPQVSESAEGQESESGPPTTLTLQSLMASNWAATKAKNPLPDSAYAYIDPSGKGHFRIDDEKHVRLAVQLLSTSPFGPKARAKVMAAAKRYGIKVSNKEWSGISLIDNLRASLFGIDDKPVDEDPPAFKLWVAKVKDAEGVEHNQLRWFGTWTNVFEDRSHDILPTFSHKEYVEYVDREDAYPELLYWHVIGTEFGKADWMEYDGMLTHAAGYIYDDPQSVQFAIAVSEEANNGMSHGTIYRTDPVTDDILQYRTFELSVLPNEYANNQGTVWISLKGTKDEAMAFSDAKKAKLKELSNISDDQIALLEQQTEAFRQSLAARGIKWKGDDEDGESDDVPNTGSLLEALTALTESVNLGFATLTTQIKEASDKADNALIVANKSKDDIIADALTPPAAAAHVAQSGAHVATKSDDNVTGGPNGANVQQRAKDKEWADQFLGMVLGAEPNTAPSK